MSASYPIYSMYVTLYTAVPTVSLLPNIQYICYATYRSTNRQPLTENTLCMLRYIPQYQMSTSYPIYSMYITLYTSVPTLSLLLNIQYVCYAIYRSTDCQPLTEYTVGKLRYSPQYQLSASYPIYSRYVTLYTTETNVSLLPNIQYVCYLIYHRNKWQLLTRYSVCMLRYIPQYQLSASYPIYIMYVMIYRSTNCQPLTQ